MGKPRFLSDWQLGSIGSTKVLSVTSAETLYNISSGMRAVEIANNGVVAVLFYGNSGQLTSAGGLFINTSGGSKFWDSIVDNFQLALRTTSGGATVSVTIHEYLGN